MSCSMWSGSFCIQQCKWPVESKTVYQNHRHRRAKHSLWVYVWYERSSRDVPLHPRKYTIQKGGWSGWIFLTARRYIPWKILDPFWLHEQSHCRVLRRWKACHSVVWDYQLVHISWVHQDLRHLLPPLSIKNRKKFQLYIRNTIYVNQ